jgi:hypothetical protein
VQDTFWPRIMDIYRKKQKNCEDRRKEEKRENERKKER